jgi:ATP-dependent DNA helicase DinG
MHGTNWRIFFPFDDVRPEQEQILDWASDLLEDPRTRNLFIEAPTGVGKSAIAVTLGLMNADSKRATYISTVDLQLEAQYVADYHELGLRNLHSASNYACLKWGDCDVGSQTFKMTPDLRQQLLEAGIDATAEKGKRCKDAFCPFVTAKREFEAGRIGLSNAAYLLTCSRFTPLATRNLLICDEGHRMADQICDQYSFSIPKKELDEVLKESHAPEQENPLKWLQHVYRPFLKDRIKENKVEVQVAEKSGSEAIQRARNQLRKLELRASNLEEVLAGNPRLWIFDVDTPQRFNVLPVWANTFATQLLAKLAPVRVFMSATLGDFERQARWLGVDPQDAGNHYLSVDCPFPEDNRLVYVNPVIRWCYDRPEEAWNRAASELRQILKMHPDKRGLVHVSSYAQAREIVERCGSPRLVTHSNSPERTAAIDLLFSRRGTVLVSPSSREGLDLFGDRSEFQVVLKLPYASLGDRRVKQRMEDDRGWYGLITAQQLVQSLGRSVRSMSDVATSYILDATWPRFLQENRKFLPTYFINALRELPAAAVR